MSEEVSFSDVVDGASDSEPLIIDETTAAPSGTPCEACGAPVEASDRFCPACGLPQTVSEEALPSAERAQIHFRCENCGSEVATDPDQRSYVCAFCDSTYVVEFSPDQTGRQDPEFVIGFSVTPDGARGKSSVNGFTPIPGFARRICAWRRLRRSCEASISPFGRSPCWLGVAGTHRSASTGIVRRPIPPGMRRGIPSPKHGVSGKPSGGHCPGGITVTIADTLSRAVGGYRSRTRSGSNPSICRG